MKWLYDHPFLILLCALVPMLVVYPVVHDRLDSLLLFDILFTLLFVVAFFVVFRQGAHRILAIILAIPAMVGSWVGYAFPNLPHVPVAVGFHLIAAVFLIFTVVSILLMIYEQTVLTADSIYGAFSGYFLIGLAFGHLYCVVETLVPDSFNGPDGFKEQMQNEMQQRFTLTYFSLITLTTVGYGDISPVKGAARGLAVVEAVIGQFYLVVLMEFVGMRLSQSSTPSNVDPPKPK